MSSEDTKLNQFVINLKSSLEGIEDIPLDEMILVEDNTEYATVEDLETKQNTISDLDQIRNNASTGAGLAPQVAVNTQRIEDLTVAKFPNVVIVGTPHIEGGQVSNYSDSSYLQFPFVDISRGQPFDIYFSFTTSNDITTQQNILDSHFGIALAILNGKGIMSLSSNGQNWDIGTSTGTNTLLPNTTYYVKYSWTGTAYSASLSTNDETYVPDMNLTSSLSPYKTTIFIGGSPNLFGAGSAHPFKGTINFNKSKVVVGQNIVWEGMADVGLASRANVSLNNLDDVGEARFNIFIAEYGVTTYNEVLEAYNNGKTVICPTDGPNNTKTVLTISQINNQYITFMGDVAFSSFIGREAVYLYSSNGKWQITSYTYFEKLNNKVQSIISSSTDAQYPSAKAVYDKLQDYATNTALGTKQDKLTAGANITIENNVISASGGKPTYVAETETLSFGGNN